MAITDAELDALALDIKFEANRLRWRKLLRECSGRPECGFAVEGLPLITWCDHSWAYRTTSIHPGGCGSTRAARPPRGHPTVLTIACLMTFAEPPRPG